MEALEKQKKLPRSNVFYFNCMELREPKAIFKQLHSMFDLDDEDEHDVIMAIVKFLTAKRKNIM